MRSKMRTEELKIKKRDKRRTLIMYVATVLAFVLFLFRGFDVQIVSSARYIGQADGLLRSTHCYQPRGL